MDIRKIERSAKALLPKDAVQLSIDGYETMKWPKPVPLMKFYLDRYQLKDYGQILFMRTDTKMGMELLTVVCMPYEGKDVPFLLIDAMQMKNKRTVFVEYYDCTANGAYALPMTAVHEKYRHLDEYDEKPAWYISERTSYSLIKQTEPDEDHLLEEMLTDSLSAYLQAASEADSHQENLKGLLAFRERMINEGNPASAVLDKVLGKKKAPEFFRQYIMPMEE